jgi:caa(3)-type oxidase subunit IV
MTMSDTTHALETTAHDVQKSHDSHDAHEDTLAPTSTFLGRQFPFPLYVVIFGILGILTIAELIVAELFPEGIVGTLALVIMSVIKAILVVWYYMHLRSESRLYILILVVPMVLGVIATLFLTSVPTTGYGY